MADDIQFYDLRGKSLYADADVAALHAENARLREVIEGIRHTHDETARRANFSGCGCEVCNELRAALSPSPSPQEPKP